MNIHFALAAQAPAGGGFDFLLIMLVVFGIMWFFMIRPQQNTQFPKLS